MGNSGCNTCSTRVLSIGERQTDVIISEVVQDLPGMNNHISFSFTLETGVTGVTGS